MPDLNSVPPSPHVLAATAAHRNSSSQPGSTAVMIPPAAVPRSPSLDILPSNQAAVNNPGSAPVHMPPPLPGPPLAPGESGPGPLRLPQPLTAADLHMQMEKEQEARINSLTRELTSLRALHNASVASNASSLSASASGAGDLPLDTHLLSGPGTTFGEPSAAPRHHRSPSSTSSRSQVPAALALLGTSSSHEAMAATLRGGIAMGRQPSVGSVHVPAGGGPVAPGMSRQGSNASQQQQAQRRSRAGSPSPAHLALGSDASATYGYFQQARLPGGLPTGPPGSSSASLVVGAGSAAATPGSLMPGDHQLSPGLVAGTSRYEETIFYKSELEAAKRENEGLKKKVRELERMLRERRDSRGESESGASAAGTSVAGGTATAAGAVAGAGAGISVAGPRESRPVVRERGMTSTSVAGSVGVGVPEEEVQVGESAASAGLRTEGV